MEWSHPRKEKREEHSQVKVSKAGKLEFEEWKASRKLGQVLLSHLKDEQNGDLASWSKLAKISQKLLSVLH